MPSLYLTHLSEELWFREHKLRAGSLMFYPLGLLTRILRKLTEIADLGILDSRVFVGDA